MEQVIAEGKGLDRSLYIMRGLPGSGKSTLAESLGGVKCSTDDYFMIDGEYRFDLSKIKEAHDWNFSRARKAIEEGKVVVVDNTNIRAWEFRPYVQAGIQNGYRIVLVEPDTPHAWNVDTCAAVNTHRVGRDVIDRLKSAYEGNLTLDKILHAEQLFAR